MPINLTSKLEIKLKIDYKKFPLTKILSLLPQYNSLFETALISINDYFVQKFLQPKF